MATETKKEEVIDLNQEKVLVFKLSQKSSPRGVTDRGDVDQPYPLQHQLRNPCLVYDEETQKERWLRYLKGYSTVWIDEQEKDKALTPERVRSLIVRPEFISGTLQVRLPVEKSLATFLLNHEDCADKKMRMNPNRPPVFHLLNREADSKKTMEFLKIRKNAGDAALITPFDEMKAHCAYLNISLNDPNGQPLLEDDLRIQYIAAAEKNPADFLSTFDSSTIKMYHALRLLIDQGVVDLSSVKGAATWSETKAVITMIPDGQEPAKYLTKFALSKDGAEFQKLLEKKTQKK